MKTIFLSIICLMMLFSANAQEVSEGQTRVFSFTPISKKVTKVNGLAFGVGTGYENFTVDKKRSVTINGLNLEINPLTPFIMMFIDPPRMDNNTPTITNNGLYIGAGGFLGNTVQNGVAISVYSITTENNGVSVSAWKNAAHHLNGLHIAADNTASKSGAGVLIAVANDAALFKGLQLGLFNTAETLKGVQIGLYNKSKARGLQLGLWNTNGKRSLPFINL